jgi:hypothetical protein
MLILMAKLKTQKHQNAARPANAGPRIWRRKSEVSPDPVQSSYQGAAAPRSGMIRAAIARTRSIAVVQGNGDRHDVAISEICSEIGGLGQG